MKVNISRHRNFISTTEGTIEVPDKATKQEINSLVRAAVKRGEIPTPRLEDADWDCDTHVSWNCGIGPKFQCDDFEE